MEKSGVTVVVADDEFYVRSAMVWLLKEMHYEVVGEASNGSEVIDLARSHKPSLVLLDISMPDATGMEALPALIAECPGTRVIMLTSMADEETVEECLRLGAAGFIRKDLPPDEVNALIREVLAGEVPAP